MVWIVVTIHLLLSLGLLWASWQAWQLRVVLNSVANTVNGYARACEQGLSVSPPAILIAQQGAAVAKVQYKNLLPQIKRVQLILSIVSRLQSLGKFRKNSRRSDRYGKRHR
ncbi:hypothetical protein Syn7502_00459 [Synechococcus sp. PCC 7502]|uniref:hypothetical protein n=1 Tax=Synechococcus sp. PCC 7502 TaxID=1173263 RepID=UPI00029F9232|nr:hypothetical protein [Synechococcus sp. PCC 7502]AFY72619.1 hypothetical protein Syn7502_00459 [Synechococcus sp. PCC 7502]